MRHGINEAIEMGAENLILYSSRTLTPAISLYRKFDFQEIPVEKSEYARCDIKMIKKLM
jgi:ribosomal protein S18 acetylase RimI-like enzyme